ncbi:MAG TPA: M56 family metallopeptidase [Candidatus Methylacidiphilales bacterium]|nr:M56 family metallopeptidase [Candidatus Methylacidiphilales bacterium]
MNLSTMPWVQQLGWMLIHSLWQGILIWCLFRVVLAALARRSPQARYLTACIAMTAMAIMPWLTYSAIDLSTRLQNRTEVAVPAANRDTGKSTIVSATPAVQVPAGSQPSATPTPSSDSHAVRNSSLLASVILPCMVALWSAGVIFSLGRLWMQWYRVQRLMQQPLRTLSADWAQRFERMKELSGIRQVVRIGESVSVSVPIVAGWMKPLILLPIGAITSMPAEQVEAVIFHELAHIARRDYLVNLVQSIVETIFFYHPAVWSISKTIREERELACDDLAVEWCRDKRTYARALAAFEELRVQAPLLAASGDGVLLQRIRRIVSGPQAERQGTAGFAVAAGIGIGLYFASMFVLPAMAESVMTDSQRVARIKELQPAAPGPEDSNVSREHVSVSGKLTTDDGSPLPSSLFDREQNLKQSAALITSVRLGGSSSGGLFMTDSRDNRYYGHTDNGVIYLGVWAEGYAPIRKGGLESKGGKLNVDLLLKRGFPAYVQITGPGGEPLSDVEITATSSRAGEPLNLSMPAVRTDARGMAVFGNVEAGSEIHLVAGKSGWQMAHVAVSNWRAGTPFVLKLQPATSTAGRIIDRADGKPVARAELRLAARRGPGESGYKTFGPTESKVLGYSDDAGRFDLKNLASTDEYYLYVSADHYPTISFPVRPGDKDRVCELVRGYSLKGKIVDPKGILTSLKATRPLELEVHFTVQATPFSGYGVSKRQALTTSGPDISFAFDDIPDGKISVNFPINELREFRYGIDLKQNVDNYVIDLNAKPSSDKSDERPLRHVEIKLNTPPGTLATGYVEMGYETSLNGQTWVTSKTLPLTDGKAVAEIPVPTKLTLRADRVLGYWFAPESLNVSADSGTFDHEIPAVPAGVIHGTVSVSGDGGNTVSSVQIAAIALEPPAGMAKTNITDGPSRRLSPENRYVTNPLPLNGKYAVVLAAAPRYFVSPAITVDAEHPLVVQNMDISTTTVRDEIKGRFVDEENKPVRYQQILLIYHPTEESSFTSVAAITGNDGTFKIADINFDVPGYYEVQIYGDVWNKSDIRINRQTPQPILISLHGRSRQETKGSEKR